VKVTWKLVDSKTEDREREEQPETVKGDEQKGKRLKKTGQVDCHHDK
jgi:hypothetical protein